jgi:DNA polymerase V
MDDLSKLTKVYQGEYLDIYKVDTSKSQEFPFYDLGISCGFPSPANDFIEERIDLNKYVVANPAATFFARAKGLSLVDVGIADNDLLAIDRGITPKDGHLAACFIDGDFIAKRLKVDQSGLWLMPANSNYKPIQVTAFNKFIIWGVITHSIRRYI